jgi:hypothetical protein
MSTLYIPKNAQLIGRPFFFRVGGGGVDRQALKRIRWFGVHLKLIPRIRAVGRFRERERERVAKF